MQKRLSGVWRGTRLLGCAPLLAVLAGCSLISLKSPERPLSQRDLNARILTRELSSQFVAEVARCTEDMVTSETDPAVLEHAMRWELAAVAQSRRAATRTTPMMSLVDSWALGAQMRAFVDDGGAGATLFGGHQQAVREISDNFATDTEALARRLLGAREFGDYQAFIQQYARQHPLEDLSFARASVVEQWAREQGADANLLGALGTIPQAMADVADRVQIYGDTEPAQLMVRTRLTLSAAGYSGRDVQVALRQLDERLERLSVVAESSPQLVHEAEAQVRASLREVLDRLDASSRAAAAELHTERTALFANLQSERAAIVSAVDVQRRALAADAARLADQVVKSSGDQMVRVAREVLLLLLLLAVVVLGLPFAAGYAAGRAQRGRREPSGR